MMKNGINNDDDDKPWLTSTWVVAFVATIYFLTIAKNFALDMYEMYLEGTNDKIAIIAKIVPVALFGIIGIRLAIVLVQRIFKENKMRKNLDYQNDDWRK